MSHMSCLKVNIATREGIRKALERMHLTLVQQVKEVEAHDGQRVRVDMYLREFPGIGFRKEGGIYNVYGDFWRLPIGSEEKFTGDLVQNYGAAVATEKCLAVGHRVVGEQVVGDEIHLSVVEG